ncbi:CDP-glycerol glycerophosphotransferase family protein [Aliarcobacter cryaerophilus]|uniref:CDP-glycerol glycerophosphotransferase family protein n=3 Tax=unclassified Arcobacter TaxID=2593671 RepID=A0AA96DFF9_9BACT|nr:CDP-glycerol glycerophosphotransferase family protein [Aliarcobacter cryaerophilus]WNL26814.1 CDP-glycerol glycerophosphotransferase family protein [Arcobacter sp. AZ-2023]WPD06033.1 CDP-glycerol glycerophosphotransferase family protein [Arcobacter sp. DSM 115956]WPD08125.1 CDP-glycerol glycerophosphotransferase family protein [Arcobacter sp. DSM 115955]MCT7501670.1 CDP-glycerol glycerophosphotransferase family protein [Aliarcobacter cryaerophilus]WNL32390.1 CDP-glycerol glycerophosphotrans
MIKQILVIDLRKLEEKFNLMNILEIYKNKQIYLSPHSPMTLALEQYLLKFDIKILGFIDKNKEGENISKIENLSSNFDYIFILSPNHFNAIYESYLNFFSKEKLIKVEIKAGNYSFINSVKKEEKRFFYEPIKIQINRNKFVFISKGFISANNKALYIYCIKNKIDTTILTDNKEQIEELKQYKLPYEILDTKESDYEIAIAKYIIFDQGNYTYLPKLHYSQQTIQLWHGVGLKKMSKMNNITYDYFISTSNWTNETNFKNIFSAKEFLNFGYPRNDIFFKEEDDLDFIFCDRLILKTILDNKDKKIVLYTPTHRENNNNLLLDFDSLNDKLKQLNTIFIVKLHPFILEFYSKIEEKTYSNIFFHNAFGDIYPLLKYIDILVSDYSSIVYDFLLLNKPIVFYIYDINEYKKNVSLLFDYDEFSPGIKVKNQDELENSFSKKDEYREKREEIKNLFFDKIAQNESSKNIIDKIKENN